MRHGFTNKKCPKCGGNIYIDMDYCIEGGLISWYEQESCLQCGHTNCDAKSASTETTVATTTEQKEILLV